MSVLKPTFLFCTLEKFINFVAPKNSLNLNYKSQKSHKTNKSQ